MDHPDADSFPANWQSNYDFRGAAQLNILTKVITPYPWWNLVPDMGHTFVTSGFGTQFLIWQHRRIGRCRPRCLDRHLRRPPRSRPTGLLVLSTHPWRLRSSSIWLHFLDQYQSTGSIPALAPLRPFPDPHSITVDLGNSRLRAPLRTAKMTRILC